ncbi:Hippurate hydrolase [Pseudomonas knackmussii B13]|uniref:Hippurate hydrolase n=1 Tax=Pseudomonas knackmussii (strain DSM 6978 / CCUG 54928 / LMG 23759 / B13) TaxID=1301098 RepID=A0A024HIF3_PSEKB|nr:M20 aminoacylase family protein [Pseudomonas knackmussii]CDF84651.1 Hippurate hydrolase [Pseudomonas knackmussii B13]
MSQALFAPIARIVELQDEFTRIRRQIHQHPELGFEEHRTSALVAGLLREWGYEVHEGVGGTGVVGVLRLGNGSRSLGIRADMDALPIQEASGVPHCSQHAGKMHACGHDGHTAILLCAARYLAESKSFDGTLNLIFQPAEEQLGGAVAMMDDSLFERFPCDAVYALHNAPGLPVGCFLTREGPLSASSDRVSIRLLGVGGHGAMPHTAKDPVVAAAEMVLALQTIVSRNVPSTETAVVTVGSIHAGDAPNVIPDQAVLQLSVRATIPEVRELLKKRIAEVAHGVAAVHGIELDYRYEELMPVLVNTPEETRLLREVASELVGPQRLLSNPPAGFLGSEDFAWMLQRRPGCYIALGNGQSGPSGCMVHNPGYDFNDAAIPFGASLWARLAEKYLVA